MEKLICQFQFVGKKFIYEAPKAEAPAQAAPTVEKKADAAGPKTPEALTADRDKKAADTTAKAAEEQKKHAEDIKKQELYKKIGTEIKESPENIEKALLHYEPGKYEKMKSAIKEEAILIKISQAITEGKIKGVEMVYMGGTDGLQHSVDKIKTNGAQWHKEKRDAFTKLLSAKNIEPASAKAFLDANRTMIDGYIKAPNADVYVAANSAIFLNGGQLFDLALTFQRAMDARKIFTKGEFSPDQEKVYLDIKTVEGQEHRKSGVLLRSTAEYLTGDVKPPQPLPVPDGVNPPPDPQSKDVPKKDVVPDGVNPPPDPQSKDVPKKEKAPEAPKDKVTFDPEKGTITFEMGGTPYAYKLEIKIPPEKKWNIQPGTPTPDGYPSIIINIDGKPALTVYRQKDGKIMRIPHDPGYEIQTGKDKLTLINKSPEKKPDDIKKPDEKKDVVPDGVNPPPDPQSKDVPKKTPETEPGKPESLTMKDGGKLTLEQLGKTYEYLFRSEDPSVHFYPHPGDIQGHKALDIKSGDKLVGTFYLERQDRAMYVTVDPEYSLEQKQATNELILHKKEVTKATEVPGAVDLPATKVETGDEGKIVAGGQAKIEMGKPDKLEGGKKGVETMTDEAYVKQELGKIGGGALKGVKVWDDETYDYTEIRAKLPEIQRVLGHYLETHAGTKEATVLREVGIRLNPQWTTLKQGLHREAGAIAIDYRESQADMTKDIENGIKDYLKLKDNITFDGKTIEIKKKNGTAKYALENETGGELTSVEKWSTTNPISKESITLNTADGKFSLVVNADGTKEGKGDKEKYEVEIDDAHSRIIIRKRIER